MKHSMHTSLEWQWKNSSRKNLRLCGRVPIQKEGYLLLYSKQSQGAIISGLMRCQSASACVVCSSAIARERGLWLSDIFNRADELGMAISMLTLTVRHTKKDTLKSLIDAMEQAYTNIQSSNAFVELRKTYRAKFVRVLEVTWGSNGWHPHFHIAIIHDLGAPVSVYKIEFEDKWIRHITAQGLKAPKHEYAVNIVENADNIQRANYLTKASGMVSAEFTASAIKEGRNGNLGIWEVHALAVEGNKKAKNLWLEYEEAIRGKRIISPSRGMADFFGIAWKADKDINIEDNPDFALSQIPEADKLHYVK